jgi:diguanylate cyclase (GGDEF)-like protein
MTLPMTLWSRLALHANDQLTYSILAFYFGMLLALGLYNLLLYWSLRERIYLTYFAFVASLTIGQVSMLGLGNQFLWPNSPYWGNIALPVGYCLTGFFGAAFVRQFLVTKRNVPQLEIIFLLLQIGFVMSAIAPAMGFYSFSGIAVALLGVSFTALAVVSGFVAVKRRQPGARLFLAAWSLFLLGVAMLGFRTLGWLPTNFVTSYGMEMGSVTEMLLLSFALADRIHVLKKDKEAAQREVLRSKELAMEALVKSEKLLEYRVNLRTAELDQVNNLLRKSETTQRELARHDALTGLGNRIYLQHQLELVKARSDRSGSAFALMVLDLDHFKPVNDNYGHAIGDELLIGISRRLEECVRITDIVARIGGDEFVVVIEAIADSQQATEFGKNIVENLCRPFELDGHGITVGASIGTSIYPTDTTDLVKLFSMADQAMYVAKQTNKQEGNVFRQ